MSIDNTDNIAKNVLKNSGIGMWVIELEDNAKPRLYGDDIMLELLGVSGEKTPEELFEIWNTNIDVEYYNIVMSTISKMIEGELAEVKYPFWCNGNLVYARCSGYRNMQYTQYIRLEGTHRNTDRIYHIQQLVDISKNGDNSEGNAFYYEMISEAISDGYETIYIVDTQKDLFEIFKQSEYITKHFRESAFDWRYSEFVKGYTCSEMSEEMRESMKDLSDCAFIRKELEDTKKKSYYFKDIHDNYFEMQIIKPDDYEVSGKVIVAVCNKTDAVMKEYEQKEVIEKALKAEAEANKSKTSFLFNMSHDIRTPMNAILGFTQMAIKHIDDKDKVKDCLDKAQNSGEHLLSLINDVLDMARIESGKIIIEEKPANLDDCRQELKNMVETEASKKNIELIFETSPDTVHRQVYVDVMRMHRVMVNLMNNSIKYSNTGGRLIFSAKELPCAREGYASYQYTISDNGIGMSEEFQNHLFEAFSREQNSTVSGITGTGLGLAITKQLVEMMGGTISIQSKLGVGTTVTLNFEFRVADAVEDKTADDLDTDASAIEGMRVLLVEDNEINREIACDILQDYGVVVEEADDGTTALEKCAAYVNAGDERHFECILMDIQMPIMDGYKATGEIRNLYHDLDYHIPIIAMTANAFEEDKKKAFASGMDAHIAKPIVVRDLIKTLIEYRNKI